VGAVLTGEQNPARSWRALRAMRDSAGVPLAAQTAAFHTTDEMPCFTKLPQFPDALETLQLPRKAFEDFGRSAKAEGIGYLGGCCGCNAAYIRALADGLEG